MVNNKEQLLRRREELLHRLHERLVALVSELVVEPRPGARLEILDAEDFGHVRALPIDDPVADDEPGLDLGGILENIKGAVDNLEPVKEFLGDIPGWTWGLLIAAIAGGIFLMNRHAGQKAKELYNKGVVT